MQSPLSSRRNIRPERVAPDEAFVLVAWRTVMVCPFVSQLRLDPLRSPAGAGGFRAQRMSHFLFWLFLAFGVLDLPHATKAATSAPSRALPRRRALCTNWKKPQIERQLLLRDPPVRAEPRAQQGPEPLDRVDVPLAEPVAILVAGV